MHLKKPNKSKKETKSKTDEVEQLAQTILDEKEEESSETQNEEVIDAPEVKEVKKPKKSTSYKKIEPKSEPEKVSIGPIRINKGATKTDAFIINAHINEIYQILNSIFGHNSGDYFIGSENTSTGYKNGERKRYKCIALEDRNGFQYFLWFDLTKLGAIY